MNLFTELTRPMAERPGHAYTESVKRKSGKSESDGNPWQLSRAECAVIVAIVRQGSTNAAAAMLELSPRTVMLHTCGIRKKMKVLTTMLAVLTWDRYYRGGE